jgi:hypothetical protein
MNSFTWLLIAHLLGDWLLQNDWMARGKKRGWFTLAGTTHFAVYTGSIVGALWFCGAMDRKPVCYLLLGTAIFFSHWLIDASDIVKRWMCFYRQSELEMVRVMVDQTLHLLVLGLLSQLF